MNIKLSPEQVKAVEYNKPGAYAIKGVAGSGKTTVGLHRIPFLMEKYGLDERILVVTFQAVLVEYLKHLLEKESSEGQATIMFGKDATIEERCDVTTIDKLIYRKYSDFRSRYKEHKVLSNLPKSCANEREKEIVFDNALEETIKRYADVKILNSANSQFLQDEIDFINGCLLETSKEYQIFTRKGRDRFSEHIKRPRRKSRTREAIYELRRNYNNLLIKEGKIDFPVMRLLALKEVRMNPPRQYIHLVVDECQDLDRVRLEFLKFFLQDKGHASATFLYDTTQSIYPCSWLGNNYRFDEIGIEIKKKNSSVLEKNFRTTYEIQEAAQSFLSAYEFMEQEVKPTLINRSGTKPTLSHCDSYQEQCKYIIDIIFTHTKNLQNKDIIIAARTNNELRILEKSLKEAEIECDIFTNKQASFGHNTVRLMTFNTTKGLESEVVILINLNESYVPLKAGDKGSLSLEIKLFYVAMTRASQHLYLTSYGKESPFLTSISPSLLNVVHVEDLEEYQEIEDPKLKAKVLQLNEELLETLSEYNGLFNQHSKGYSGFIKLSRELLQKQYKLVGIHAELELLKEKIDANSSLFEHFNQLYDISKNKLEKAEEEFILKVNRPVDFDKIKNELECRFSKFNQNTLRTISTVNYQLSVQQISKASHQIDYGPYLTSYSKAIEIELKKIFRRNNMPLKMGNKDLNLSELLHEMQLKDGDMKELPRMLETVNFRKLRNDATHKMTVSKSVFMPVQESMMTEEGVLELVNKLL